MQEILLRVRVSQYASCRQLVDALELGADDLLLTNRYIYDSYFAGFEMPCQVVFQEKYGAGEPSDDMAEAIYADIKGNRSGLLLSAAVRLLMFDNFYVKAGQPDSRFI